MAQTYTRQSTFADGDTITAALFNDEYNQLVNAFAYSSSSASSTGHRHDGTAGQGGNIHTIGDLDFLNKIVVDSTNNRWGFYVEVSSSAVEQIRLQDGALLPVTDSDVDLGTSSLYFKDDALCTREEEEEEEEQEEEEEEERRFLARWTRFLPAPSPRPSFPGGTKRTRSGSWSTSETCRRIPTCPSTIPKGLECSKRFPWTFRTKKSNAYSSSWRRFIRRNRGSGCRYTASDRY